VQAIVGFPVPAIPFNQNMHAELGFLLQPPVERSLQVYIGCRSTA